MTNIHFVDLVFELRILKATDMQEKVRTIVKPDTIGDN